MLSSPTPRQNHTTCQKAYHRFRFSVVLILHCCAVSYSTIIGFLSDAVTAERRLRLRDGTLGWPKEWHRERSGVAVSPFERVHALGS